MSEDVTKLKIPLVMAAGIWTGVVLGAIAVGGFVWQSYDTRTRVAEVANALSESNRIVSNQLVESNRLVAEARKEFAADLKEGFKQLTDRQDRLYESLSSLNAKVERIDERTKGKQ